MNETKHIGYLDSIRGIACMIVVFFHIIIYLYPKLPHGKYSENEKLLQFFLSYPPFSYLISGHVAVCVFFILSGYILSYRFVGENNIKWKIIEAAIKRFPRLMGLIYFSLLSIFCFVFTKEFWTTRLWMDYDIYFRCIYRFFTEPIKIGIIGNPPLWTISIELWGSFLTFGICLFIGNINKKIRMILLSICFIILIKTYYSAFIFGIIIADLHKNHDIKWFVKNKNILSWIVLIPVIICCSYQFYPDKQYWKNILFIRGGYSMIGAMSLFVFIVCNNKIKTILNLKPLVFIGGISYSIYIIHWSITSQYSNLIYNYIMNKTNENIYISLVSAVVFISLITIIISWIIDKLIDKPCIKLSTWFSKKIVNEIKNYKTC